MKVIEQETVEDTLVTLYNAVHSISELGIRNKNYKSSDQSFTYELSEKTEYSFSFTDQLIFLDIDIHTHLNLPNNIEADFPLTSKIDELKDPLNNYFRSITESLFPNIADTLKNLKNQKDVIITQYINNQQLLKTSKGIQEFLFLIKNHRPSYHKLLEDLHTAHNSYEETFQGIELYKGPIDEQIIALDLIRTNNYDRFYPALIAYNNQEGEKRRKEVKK